MKTLQFAILGLCVVTTGCLSGSLQYNPPVTAIAPIVPVTIEKPRADVWKSIVPKIGQSFFVINNLDQSSGLVNVSYSGDPEAFVDCGHIVSVVTNARGTRTYDFAAAKASESYEVKVNNDLYGARRSMNLEGRANLILEEVGPSSTRVSVHVRYVLTKTTVVTTVLGASSAPEVTTTGFSSGEQGSFDGPGAGVKTYCKSNGEMERRLMALVSSP